MPVQQAPQSPEARPRFFYGYIVAGAALFTMVITYGSYNSFGVFFRPLLSDFSSTRAMVSGAFSLSWMMQGALSIVMGRLTDRFGPRAVLTICGVLVGLGYLLLSQIGAVWQLYLFYGVMVGVGSSTFVPLTSTVARLFVKRRTVMTGIATVGIGLGSLIIPLLANKIILAYDWRMSFIVLGIMAFVIVTSAAQFLRKDITRFNQFSENNNKSGKESPRLDAGTSSVRKAVRTNQFWMIFVIFFCLGYCGMAIQVHIVPYATDINISPSIAALILSTIGGGSIVGRIVLGNVGDRIGNRQTYIIGFALMSLTILLLLPLRYAWSFYPVAFIFGMGYGSGIAQESPLVATVFGLTAHGSIFGMLSLGYTIGAATGPVVAGYIFDVTTSYQVAFVITAAIGIVSLTLNLLLKPKISVAL
ncbi:MAG: MFS transporter [Dehalococcoidia bacterium]|nr:MAG: MFS transporter [Dehalococcoidia bacterium]